MHTMMPQLTFRNSQSNIAEGEDLANRISISKNLQKSNPCKDNKELSYVTMLGHQTKALYSYWFLRRRVSYV